MWAKLNNKNKNDVKETHKQLQKNNMRKFLEYQLKTLFHGDEEKGGQERLGILTQGWGEEEVVDLLGEEKDVAAPLKPFSISLHSFFLQNPKQSTTVLALA